jgi:hypothetical protein
VNRTSTVSEIAGCLACGFLVLAACEAGYDGRWLIERNWSPAEIALCGLTALIIGRLVASVSRRLFGDRLFDGCLPRPEIVLLSREDRASPRRLFSLLQFCNFYRTMCLGLVVVAAILISGIVWHNLFSIWGQADSRRLGYAVLALLEAVAMRYRYLKFRRRHDKEVLSRGTALSRESVLEM